MVDLFLDLLMLIAMLLAIYGVGRAGWRLIPLTAWNRSADLAFSLGTGLGAITTFLFLLGLAGWLVPTAGWLLLAIGVVLAGVQYRKLWDDLHAGWETLKDIWSKSGFAKAVITAALIFALINLTTDLAPVMEGDSVHKYLLVPRYWVEAGRYTQPTHIWSSTLPGNMMMVSAWALLLRSNFVLPGLITGFGMSILFALGVYALARLHFNPMVGVLAIVAIYTMPDTGYLAQSAKVDMGWAFFEALALSCFLQWVRLTRSEGETTDEDNPLGWLMLSGLWLGLAAGSKIQTLISIVLLGLWLVGRMALRGNWRGLLRYGVALGGMAVIGMLPYYAYNAVAHANPFYPVFAEPFVNLFGATPSARSELGTEVFYPWTVGGYFSNLWNASLGHMQPGFYLGFIAGPIFLLVIPVGIALGALRGKRVVWEMLSYALIFSVVWFLVKQAVRHFIPGLMLLAVVVGVILDWLNRRQDWQARGIEIAVLMVLGVNIINMLGVLYWSGAYRVALGIESRMEFVERWHNDVIVPTFPDWETIQVLNTQLDSSDRVLAEHAASMLYIELDVVSPKWGDRQRLGAITSERELLQTLADADIEYLLVSNADPDDRYLFTQEDFLTAHAKLIHENSRTRLYHLTD